LIAALVVGDQQAIEQSDWDVFRATGVAHLMSISGMHVTMFAWFAGMLVGALWRRSVRLCAWVSAPSAALGVGVLLAAAYALFSGWGVPAQRTVWMLTTVGLLRLLGLRWPWPQVWLLTCAVVVLMDPWALLQAGFWLSFVAVGVLFATDHSATSLAASSIRLRLLAALREQWLITLALAPLSLLLFGQVSLIALLANAVAIPWVTLLITPLAMAGVLWSGFWELCHWASLGLLLLLSWLAQWPWASYQVPQAPAWIGAASVLGALLLVLRAPWAWRLLGLPLLLPLVMWRVPVPPAGQFELLTADIGQGNAVLLRTQSHSLLFDAGPRFSQESDAGHRVLLPLMRSLGVKLDMLVLSHRDTDHTGGAVSVLTAQPTAQLLSSIGSEHPLQALRPVQPCTAGQHWRWDGVDFEVLHPSSQELQERHKTNALSCVLRVSNGQQTALLTGDIEQAQETQLLALGNRLQAQWLMVPHHGSKTSSSGAFLDAVAPRFALVQAGYRNRFGHPASPVLVRYQERKIQIVDTPHCGAATWRSWQPEFMACQRRLQARYWHHRLP
jgi:competence protein ComEC